MNGLSVCAGTGAADLSDRPTRWIPPTLTNGIPAHALNAWYAAAFLALYKDLLEGLVKDEVARGEA